MKFSNKIKYGLQFFLFISVDAEPHTDIQRAAISCNISHKILEAIAIDLKKQGLLAVKRGAGGGYKLAKKNHEIKVPEVVKKLEKKKMVKKITKKKKKQQKK